MHNKNMLYLCSQLLDKITVINGYLRLNMERKNVDYSFFIFQALKELEEIANKMSDIAQNAKKDSGNT
ncbi:MAG: hypothetical protein A4E53_02924 [Pelotomaculum sp. PtaB.Bin104]|nr:MAG: hypothetical protein A4E53_02924 [Pelotomaculum sp. PtaB.Bin104]